MWAPSPPWGLLGESPRRFRVPRARVYPSTARRKRRVYRFSGGSARTNYAAFLICESFTKLAGLRQNKGQPARISALVKIHLLEPGHSDCMAPLPARAVNGKRQTHKQLSCLYILARIPQATQALTLLDICPNWQQIHLAANTKTPISLHIYRHRGCANCNA